MAAQLIPFPAAVRTPLLAVDASPELLGVLHQVVAWAAPGRTVMAVSGEDVVRDYVLASATRNQLPLGVVVTLPDHSQRTALVNWLREQLGEDAVLTIRTASFPPDGSGATFIARWLEGVVSRMVVASHLRARYHSQEG